MSNKQKKIINIQQIIHYIILLQADKKKDLLFVSFPLFQLSHDELEHFSCFLGDTQIHGYR